MIRGRALESSNEIIKELEKGILLTSGNKQSKNVMTISWGTIGHLWGKDVFILFVRPSRYTYELLNKTERLTLSFLPESYQKQVITCGRVCGKEKDKFDETNLTPVYDVDQDLYYVKEAKRVLKLKKLACLDMKNTKFFNEDIKKDFYVSGDFHRMYICEITSCLNKEDE